MKNKLKKMTLLSSIGMLGLAFSLPTNAVEEAAAKCSPQPCETPSGVGICCLVGVSAITCSPCGAVDVILPAAD